MRRRGTIATVIAISMVLVGGVAYAEVGGQIIGLAAAPFSENPNTIEDIPREYRRTDNDELYGGLEAELWFDHFGVGLRHLGRFDVQQVEVFDETKDPVTASDEDAWWYDGKSDLFLAFHLFGGGSLIDPYIRYGIGLAQRVEINEGFQYDAENERWTTTDRGDADDGDDTEADASYDQITNAGIYQYLGTGAQVNLAGLVVGVGVNYNLINQRVGASEYNWEVFPTQRFEARMYGGVAF